MNKDEFNKLPQEDQDAVFDEMCELYELVENNPIGYKELKIFTEWASWMGCFGEDLEKRLNGFYPDKWLNDGRNINEVLLASSEAVRFVKLWFKIVQDEYFKQIYK